VSETTTKRFTHEEICAILPQQPPFMFLDESEITGDNVVSTYRIRGDEFFLKGHFKDDPVFPASIVFEALGQAACLWVLVNAPSRLGAPLNAGQVLFASMDGAHFYRKTRPGDTLVMKLKLAQLRAPLAIFRGSVWTADNKRVAELEKVALAFGVEAPE
jgi:3-hydroxymyristoyl/3-hydroxydecanoyl-(acyl carrier protein) dehydratase